MRRGERERTSSWRNEEEGEVDEEGEDEEVEDEEGEDEGEVVEEGEVEEGSMTISSSVNNRLCYYTSISNSIVIIRAHWCM